jgi:hypothetical protein|tara:strand:+ start:4373 stop:4549 length:177 start_codon:yes stop_codon:yes gene_type:complete
MNKLGNSIKVAVVMVLARKYGKYHHTVGGHEHDIFVSYHVYEYKGKIYHFPATDNGKD